MDVTEIVEDIAERGRENLVQQLELNERLDGFQHGVEIEYPHLDLDGQVIPAEQYMSTVDSLAAHPATDAHVEQTDPAAPTVGVEFTEDFYGTLDERIDTDYQEIARPAPEADYDFGPELEVGTGIALYLEDAHNQIVAIENTVEDSLSSGALYPHGLAPALMFDEFEDEVGWDVDADDPLEQFITPKSRYRGGLKDVYTMHNMPLGLTGSIQVTAAPDPVYDEDGDIDPDATATGFLKTTARTGMLNLAPFLNSPVIVDGEIDTYYGRERAYEKGRTNGPLLSQEQGEAKYGLYPEIQYLETMENIVWMNITKPVEFLSRPVSEIMPADDGKPLHERDEFAHLSPGDELNVIGARKKNGGYSDPVTLAEVFREQRLEGTVKPQDVNGDYRDTPVTLRYDTDELDDIKFELYDDIEGTNVPSYRFRSGVGAFESRDFCNNSFPIATIGQQSALFRKWQEIRDVADEYGLDWDDAETFRDKIPEKGMAYKDGFPLEYLSDVDDILYQGAGEMSRTAGPANKLQDYLHRVEATGNVPGDHLAQAAQDGVDAFMDTYSTQRLKKPAYAKTV